MRVMKSNGINLRVTSEELQESQGSDFFLSQGSVNFTILDIQIAKVLAFTRERAKKIRRENPFKPYGDDEKERVGFEIACQKILEELRK